MDLIFDDNKLWVCINFVPCSVLPIRKFGPGNRVVLVIDYRSAPRIMHVDLHYISGINSILNSVLRFDFDQRLRTM